MISLLECSYIDELKPGRTMLQAHFDNVVMNTTYSTTALLDSTSSTTTNSNDGQFS